MVFYNVNRDGNEKIMKIECSCGCGEEIRIQKNIYTDDTADYYLSLVMMQFYAKQNGIFKTIKHRIKTAFNILRGKEYKLTDIILKEEDMKELKEIIKEI